MSHFQNSTPQKRGQLAAQRGSRIQHALAQSSGPPQSDHLYQHDDVRATKRRRHASVGDHHSNGLVIHGSHDVEFNEGDNPDSATPPLAGDSLRVPDWPISFNGLGMMKFVNPVRIPTIDGTLNVRGSIYSNGTLLGGGGGTARTSFTPVLEDTSSNSATHAVQAGFFYTSGAYTLFEIAVEWTDKGSMSGDVQVTLPSPFPTLSVTPTAHVAVNPITGFAVTTIGNHLIGQYNSASILIREVYPTSAATNTTVQASQLSTAGSLTIWGFLPTGT